MSPFKMCQNSLINLKLTSSDPRLFEFPQSQMASLISSSPNLLISMPLSSLEIFLKLTSSKGGLSQSSSPNLSLKNFHASFLTSKGSSFHEPFTYTPLMMFLLLLQFTTMWWNFEWQSPSLSHLNLDFCLSKDSLSITFLQKSSCSPFLTSTSSKDIPPSSLELSKWVSSTRWTWSNSTYLLNKSIQLNPIEVDSKKKWPSLSTTVCGLNGLAHHPPKIK